MCSVQICIVTSDYLLCLSLIDLMALCVSIIILWPLINVSMVPFLYVVSSAAAM